jgi:hypothetical protein
LAFVGDGADIYVRDLARDTTTRITFTGHAVVPVWTPDGNHLLFESVGNGFSFYWVRSDGSGEPQQVLQNPNVIVPFSFAPDGRLAYLESNPDTEFDLWTLPLDIADPDHPKPGKPLRCQAMTVLGVTMIRADRQPLHSAHSHTHRSRSGGASLARFTERWRTPAGDRARGSPMAAPLAI